MAKPSALYTPATNEGAPSSTRSGAVGRHKCLLASIALFFLLPIASAQVPSSSGSSSSGARATQLPLSGRQSSDSVSVDQSANTGSGNNTLNTRVSVSGNTAGSIPDPSATTGPVTLTLEDAIRRGLAFNLGRVTADTSYRAAQAQLLDSRSHLLPQISASLGESAAKVDLAAEGFSASVFGGAFSGFTFPTAVGPFHYYDLHGSLQEDFLDFTAIHNLRSAKQSEDAAGLNAKDERERVVLAVAGTYLQAIATSALLEEQQVEVRYAESSYKQARAQSDAGNKAPIDATRSLV
jgi:hypothetical protein